MARTIYTEAELISGLTLMINQQPLREVPLIITLDGRSGAGKTTLADTLKEELTSQGHTVTLIHMEDMYQGWNGLADGARQWSFSATSISQDGPAMWFGWDWEKNEKTGPFTKIYEHSDTAVPRSMRSRAPRHILLCEGVGAMAGAADLSIWLEVDEETRKERAIARDGKVMEEHWDMWKEQEDQLFEDRSVDYKSPSFYLNMSEGAAPASEDEE